MSLICSALISQENIKEERKKPLCSMCRNHKVMTPSAGHKNDCTFDNAEHRKACVKCTSTHERRILWAKKIDKRRKIYKILEIVAEPIPGRQRRQQMCSKCLAHGIKAANKDHKKLCLFKHCKCDKCMVVVNSCKAFNKEAEEMRQSKPKSQEIKLLPMLVQDKLETEEYQVTQIYLDLLSSTEPNYPTLVENLAPKVESNFDINMEDFITDIMDLIETNKIELSYENIQEQPQAFELDASNYPAPRILNDEVMENPIGLDFVSDVESDLNDLLFFDFFEPRKLS